MSPRHYAAAFMAATTKEQQKQAVAGCPPEWRDLVREHIKTARLFKAAAQNEFMEGVK